MSQLQIDRFIIDIVSAVAASGTSLGGIATIAIAKARRRNVLCVLVRLCKWNISRCCMIEELV